MAESNPNGANGTTSDPREQAAWDIYVENLQNGIDNATKAALEAGYGEGYAKNITARDWFVQRKDKLRRKGLLSKAERVLDKTLNYNPEVPMLDKDGVPVIDKEGNPLVLIDKGLLKIQADVAKTVATTLGSKEGYVSKSEVEVTTLSEEEKRKMRGLLVEVPEETLKELINDNETSVG